DGAGGGSWVSGRPPASLRKDQLAVWGDAGAVLLPVVLKKGLALARHEIAHLEAPRARSRQRRRSIGPLSIVWFWHGEAALRCGRLRSDFAAPRTAFGIVDFLFQQIGSLQTPSVTFQVSG